MSDTQGMTVLVATPARKKTPPVFRQRSDEIYDVLTHEAKERGLFVNDCKRRDGAGKYDPNARARNRLIDALLDERHTHVLWLDVDLVTVPSDLIERLSAVSKRAVVAPLVYMERRDDQEPPSPRNGGWFYDTGGFVHEGKTTDMWNPAWLEGAGDVIEMDSVGCCYLIPANAYRFGARYSASGKEVEHVPFMRQVREMGYPVLAVTTIAVEHAYLPLYGQGWN